MGLTVSRKTAKNLAVRRKNERILTVSRQKMLTVKKSNHKIRSRDLLFLLQQCTYQRPSRGVDPGEPRAFAPRHLQIPPTQGQYSSTKSYHCPFPGKHNLKGLLNCNVILGIIFTKSLKINICSKTK